MLASISRQPGRVAGLGILPSWDRVETWKDAGLSVSQSDDEVAAMLHQFRGTTLIEGTGAECGETGGLA